MPPPWCDRCGEPLDQEGCGTCLDWPDTACRVRSAVLLAGGAQQVVHHLKYGGWRRAAHPMAECMRQVHPPPPGAVLVPIPLGSLRRRHRGYNQAEELARALASRVEGAMVATDLLVRTRETATQTKLTPEARRANVHRAFAARRTVVPGPVVLVDDVFTTGATLLAAAEALAGAGVSPLSAVTFARAPGPLGLAGA